MELGLWLHLFAVLALTMTSLFRLTSRGTLKYVGNPLWIVLALYCTSAISSLFVKPEYIPGIYIHDDSFLLVLAYTLLICINLVPVLMLRGSALQPQQIAVHRQLRLVLWLFAIGAWFAVIYQAPYAVSAFAMGADQVRSALNVHGESLLPTSFATTLAVGISSFYLVYLFLFFIALANGLSRVLTLSMLVGSLSYVVSSYTFGARDGVVFFLLALAFAYSIFRSLLSQATKRRLRILASVVVLATIGSLVQFTVDRFGDAGSSGLASGTVGYIGQQPYVFVETVESQHYFYGLSLRFPTIAELFGTSTNVIRSETFEWSFGTFLKDYYSMFGWPSLVGLSLFGALVFGAVVVMRKKFPPVTLLLLVALYFQLMTSGIFYFRQGTEGGNLYLALYGVLVVASHIFVRRRVQSAASVSQ